MASKTNNKSLTFLFETVLGLRRHEYRASATANLASGSDEFFSFGWDGTAVTCVIPATSKPHHMIDNLGAGNGEMPDDAMRQRMAKFFAGL